MSIDLAAASAALEGKTPKSSPIANSDKPLVTTNFRHTNPLSCMAVQAA